MVDFEAAERAMDRLMDEFFGVVETVERAGREFATTGTLPDTLMFGLSGVLEDFGALGGGASSARPFALDLTHPITVSLDMYTLENALIVYFSAVERVRFMGTPFEMRRRDPRVRAHIEADTPSGPVRIAVDRMVQMPFRQVVLTDDEPFDLGPGHYTISGGDDTLTLYARDGSPLATTDDRLPARPLRLVVTKR